MPSVAHAINDFVGSIVGIFISLFESVFAVFHGIFALGANVVNSVLTIVNHLVAMVMDLFQGVLGFIAANFVAIAVIVVGFYAYTTYTARSRRTVKGKSY